MVASLQTVTDWLYPNVTPDTTIPDNTIPERITVDLCDLDHNQLFVYRGSLYYLMETPATIMKAEQLNELILDSLKLPAMRIASFDSQPNGVKRWIGCCKPYVEQFWATAEVQPFTYNPGCIK